MYLAACKSAGNYMGVRSIGHVFDVMPVKAMLFSPKKSVSVEIVS